MGRSISRVPIIFSKWSLNFLTTSFSSVITLSPSTRIMLSSLRVLSVKFDLIVCQNFLLLAIVVTLRLLQKTFLDFLRSLTQRFFHLLQAKRFSAFIIFPIFIKNAAPSHNCFSELFIHKGELVTSSTFSLHWGMSIKYSRGNLFKFFKFSRVKILNRYLLKKIWCVIKVIEIFILDDFRFMLCKKNF